MAITGPHVQVCPFPAMFFIQGGRVVGWWIMVQIAAHGGGKWKKHRGLTNLMTGAVLTVPWEPEERSH